MKNKKYIFIVITIIIAVLLLLSVFFLQKRNNTKEQFFVNTAENAENKDLNSDTESKEIITNLSKSKDLNEYLNLANSAMNNKNYEKALE